MQLLAVEVAFHPQEKRLGKQALFARVILEGDEFGDGFRENFLRQGSR